MNPNNPNPDPQSYGVDIKPVNMKQYEFDNYKTVTVVNPKNEDFNFLVEGKAYSIKAGSKKRFPGYIATLYIRKMAMILAQDEKKIQFITDNTLLETYYKRLIIGVDDLVGEHQAPDADSSFVPQSTATESGDGNEKPFATANDEDEDEDEDEDTPTTNPNTPPPVPSDKPLKSQNRTELNATAKAVGIDNPEGFESNRTLREAIVQKDADNVRNNS